MARLCPQCGRQLSVNYPQGRKYTTQDGRKVVALVWRHRNARSIFREKRPPDCTALWPEADATPERVVTYRT